ncbi:UBX domain-containing protein 7-like [Oscarella lobularis]|uniref:UBX domain-containing protein 7-like n=1 Tax=Oscarella lobularis TaxID=121494 RepID=UPI003313F60B
MAEKDFIAVTGASKKIAASYLAAADGNLQVAIEMFFCEDTEASGGGASKTNAPISRKRRYGDDEDDGPGERKPNDVDDEDNVRPPIPPTAGVLVQDSIRPIRRPRRRGGGSRSVFEGFRDFREETRAQEAGFAQPKRKTLEGLFRPPVDITFSGSFDQAKEYACARGKWLLVNVQNPTEFSCQALNRDVWSNRDVRRSLKADFILWQVYNDSDEGEKFKQFYPFAEYPHIAFIDPRTGERLQQLENVTAESLILNMNDFLSCQDPLSVSPSEAKRFKVESIIDESEEEQIKAAIAQSLAEAKKAKIRKIIIDGSDSETATDVSSKYVSEEEEEEEEGEKKEGEDEDETRTSLSQGSQLADDCGKLSIAGDREKRTEVDKWTVDDDNLEATKILLRLPDGKRETVTLSKEAPVTILLKVVEAQGFPLDKYHVVTHFPRKNLCELDASVTLRKAGLWPRETAFVQEIDT